MRISNLERLKFFGVAIKEHFVLYLLSVAFLVGFGGYGLFMLIGLDASAINFITKLGGWIFISVGIGAFVLMFYLNISSVSHSYDAQILKHYGRYKRAKLLKVEHEVEYSHVVNSDGDEEKIPTHIRCYLNANYNFRDYVDIFELKFEDKALLARLEEKTDIPVRIVDTMPQYFRVAPRKLISELRSGK